MSPTSKTSYARLMVLKYVVVHSLATERPMLPEIFSKWSERERREFDDNCRKQAEANVKNMQKIGLWKHASPMEKDFAFLGKPFRSISPDEYQMATSIIMERHVAMNWLCGMAPGNMWDETPTET